MTPKQQKLLEQLLALNNDNNSKQELSKLDHIISAFSTMNISSLKILLDDFKTYQNVTKETFLEKLEKTFTLQKKMGDDHFIAYPEKHNSTNNHYKNDEKISYRFVGNTSRNYVDFAFELSCQNISDIYNSYDYTTDEVIENLEDKIQFYFYMDEAANFIKTPEYLIKINRALAAFSEISTIPPKVLDFEQLSGLIDKYAFLYQSIGKYDALNFAMKWTAFACLYSDLKKIKDFLDSNCKQIQIANKEYKTLKTEQNYIDWIVKYEDISKRPPYCLQHNVAKKKGLLRCNLENNTTVFFSGKVFFETYYFIKYYRHKNRVLNNKYCIYTSKEYWAKSNDSNDDDLSSLKYHLQKREALAKIGIEIPFYKKS